MTQRDWLPRRLLAATMVLIATPALIVASPPSATLVRIRQPAADAVHPPTTPGSETIAPVEPARAVEGPPLAPAANSEDAVSAGDLPVFTFEDDAFTDRLQRLLNGCCHNWLDGQAIEVYGWLEASLALNPQSPETHTNGPVTYTDRANEILFNQLGLVVERTTDQRLDYWQAGGRIDLLFGSDAAYVAARGIERDLWGDQRWNGDNGPNRSIYGPDNGSLYGLAMPQLYAEFSGHDLSLKIGHFYTILTYEQVPAPLNFFITRSYAFQFNPITHTGILANYRLNDRWSVNAGAIRAVEQLDRLSNLEAFLGGVEYFRPETGTKATFSVVAGKQQLTPSFDPTLVDDALIYSFVLDQQITRKWKWVFEHTAGWQEQAAPALNPANFSGIESPNWCSIANYLLYEVNRRLRVGGRFEWFHDGQGYRILQDGERADYFELSAGTHSRLADWALWRNEIRWDWVDKTGIEPFDLENNPSGGRPIGRGGAQFLFTTDVVLTF